MSSTRQPNIVMLVADDHQANAMGWCSDGTVQTPMLDALAARGTAWTRAYHMGGKDDAVCIPTRASLLTGMDYFHSMKGGRGVIDPGRVTLPEQFRQAGYGAYGVGKWHNDRASLARSFDGGGALFLGGMHDHYQTPLRPFDPEGIFPEEEESIGNAYSMDLFSDAACSFVETYRQPEPFFLYTAFTAPHDPRTPPRHFADLYDPDVIDLPPNFMPVHPFDHGTSGIRDERLAPSPRTPARIRRELADYYGMISSLDAGVGRIVEALERTGQLENTLIVYTGDHGLAMGQHGLLGKQNVYEHSARVPLILAGPGVPVGQTSQALVYSWDLYATLCDLAGVTHPGDMDSRSVAPVLTGKSETHRERLCALYGDTQKMIVEERWKLIACTAGGATHVQLFNLQRDPWELNNLADDPSFAGERERLLSELARSPVGLPAGFDPDESGPHEA